LRLAACVQTPSPFRCTARWAHAQAANRFGRLRLSNACAKGLERAGIDAPLPIQTAAFSPIAQGDDVLLHAETGSGKTLAFLLPALCALEGDAPWQLLVIAPTNLLIRQIATVARDLGHGEADVCALLSLESQSPTFKMQESRFAATDIAAAESGEVRLRLPPQTLSPLLGAAALDARIVLATPAGLCALMRSEHRDSALARANASLQTLVVDEADAVLRPHAGKADPAPVSAEGRPQVSISRAMRNKLFDASPFVNALRRLTRGDGEQSFIPRAEDIDGTTSPRSDTTSPGQHRRAKNRGRVQLVACSATVSTNLGKDVQYALLQPGRRLRLVTVRTEPVGATKPVAAEDEGAEVAGVGAGDGAVETAEVSAREQKRRAKAQRGLGGVGMPALLSHHFATCNTLAEKVSLALQVADELCVQGDSTGSADFKSVESSVDWARGPSILFVGRDGVQCGKVLTLLDQAGRAGRTSKSGGRRRTPGQVGFPSVAALFDLDDPLNVQGGASLKSQIALATLGEIRGLDLPYVRAVVLLAAPADVDAYVHVVGRTARVGRAGHAVSLLTEAEWRACNGQLSAALGISTKPLSTLKLLQKISGRELKKGKSDT